MPRAQARDLAMAKQERSHEQMGDMLALFDKYDAQAKQRNPNPSPNPNQLTS